MNAVSEALVLVVLVWAVVLVPGALKSRSRTRRDVVDGFERPMEAASTDRPEDDPRRRPVLVAGEVPRDVQPDVIGRSLRFRREDPVIARRRLWFQRMLAGTALTLVVALVFGGWLWLAFGITLALTATYVAVLRYFKLQRDEVRRVLRELELADRDEPALADEPVVEDAAVANGTPEGGSHARPQHPDE